MSDLRAMKEFAMGHGFSEDEVMQYANDPRMHTIVAKAMKHDNSGGGSTIADSAMGASGGMGYKNGGAIKGKGTGTSDSIPANLSNGEYVIPADVVQMYGRGTFDKMIQSAHTPVANGG